MRHWRNKWRLVWDLNFNFIFTFMASTIRGMAFDVESDVPYPSWPWLLDPQVYRTPLSKIATECRFANATSATLSRLNVVILWKTDEAHLSYISHNMQMLKQSQGLVISCGKQTMDLCQNISHDMQNSECDSSTETGMRSCSKNSWEIEDLIPHSVADFWFSHLVIKDSVSSTETSVVCLS